MPDPSLPSTMTPFQLIFGRSPRTTRDMLVPQKDDTEAEGGLSNFIESHRHNMREVVEALKKLHEDKEVARQRHNAGICLLYTSPSPRDKRQSRMPSSA